MGAYSIDTLIRKWGRGELTVEQVIGQILQHVQELQASVLTLEHRVDRTRTRRRPDREEDE
jgi:hypothetical protein